MFVRTSSLRSLTSAFVRTIITLRTMPFYGVQIGRKPGIYTSWTDCEGQIKGFVGARYKKFNTEQEAQDFVKVVESKAEEPASESTSSKKADATTKSGSKKPTVYYAVQRGKQPGIYTSWADCQTQIKEFPGGARFKKFDTEQEAQDFIDGAPSKKDKAEKSDKKKKSEDDASAAKRKHSSDSDEEEEKETSSGAKHSGSKKPTVYYAVQRGRKPGIYTSWAECESQTKGFSGGPRFKKFNTEQEAQDFIDGVPSKKVDKSGAKKRKTEDDEEEDASDEIPPDAVTVYTDGCCHSNGKSESCAGIGVYWGPNHANNLSEKLQGRQTNNRAEIYAAKRAIEQAKAEGIKHLVIKTDSQFLINCVTEWMAGWKKKGWKTAKGEDVVNREELEELDAAAKNIKVTYIHVDAHTGIEGNEAADRLANEGARKKE